LALLAPSADAADAEPRSYSNIPTGLNFLIAGYTYTQGNVSFAPTVPITNGKITIHTSVFAYVRSLDFWGHSGKLDIILPQAWLSGTAEVEGKPRQRDTSGFADPLFRLYVNLYGAPSLPLKDFASYEQDIIIGASFAVSPPGGRYNPDKLVNIGTNRWYFKPELGLSKAWGPLIAETAVGAYFFTDNSDFYPGKTLQQAPMWAAQAHLIYNFAPGIWGSLDANYYGGGRTTTGGVLDNDLQQNWRLGATLSLPLSKQHSIKLYGNTGVAARTGSNYDTIGITFQYRWGEGL
jgi:hypothetical protein